MHTSRMTEPTDDPGMLSPAAGSLETTYGVITHRDDAVRDFADTSV